MSGSDFLREMLRKRQAQKFNQIFGPKPQPEPKPPDIFRQLLAEEERFTTFRTTIKPFRRRDADPTDDAA